MNMKGRKDLYWLVFSLLMPLVILGSIEMGLRYARYGVNLDDLFLTTPDGRYLYMNKDISKRYFTRSQATTGNVEFFKKVKDARTFRLFVLGESAALGFPYPNNISFQRMLKYALQQANPDKDIEIINLSLTAINSYTFYDFGKELARYRPDALLIYGGHNEYYGALGVGSTNTFGSNRAFVRTVIRLRQTKLVQLLENLIDEIKPAGSSAMTDNLMKYVVKEQLIGYESPLFYRGIDQFRENLRDLLMLWEKQQIPVFCSTVATNLKDQYPFKSILKASTDSATYYNRLETARHLFHQGELASADSLLASLHQEDASNADCAYTWGQVKLATGDSTSAFSLLNEAKQKDALRFRAPDEINETVRELSSHYPNVRIVEAEQAFKEESAQGIPGKELLLEHVHPTIQGHRLIAHAFLQTLQNTDLLQKKGITSPQDTRTCFSTFPALPFDSLAGEYACHQLKKGFPFYETGHDSLPIHTPVQALALQYVKEKNWYKSMDQLYKYAVSAKDYPLALDVMRVRMTDNEYDPAFYNSAGEISVILHRYDEALTYYRKSFFLHNTFASAREIIATALRNDQPDVALIYMEYAIANNQSEMDFRLLKEYCTRLIRYKKEAGEAPSREVYREIAALYTSMGNTEVAELYSRKQQSVHP